MKKIIILTLILTLTILTMSTIAAQDNTTITNTTSIQNNTIKQDDYTYDIQVNELETTQTTNIKYPVKITHNKQSINNVLVKLYIKSNPKYIQSYNTYTNSNGEGEIIIPQLDVGSYDVELNVENTGEVMGTSYAYSKIIVKDKNTNSVQKTTSTSTNSKGKVNVNVKLLYGTVKYHSKAIKAQLKLTSNGKVLGNVKVCVTVKGGKVSNSYILKSNKKGLVTIPHTRLKEGTYKIKVTSKDKKYKVKKTVKLKVKRKVTVYKKLSLQTQVIGNDYFSKHDTRVYKNDYIITFTEYEDMQYSRGVHVLAYAKNSLDPKHIKLVKAIVYYKYVGVNKYMTKSFKAKDKGYIKGKVYSTYMDYMVDVYYKYTI